jgi:hypothetical protein
MAQLGRELRDLSIPLYARANEVLEWARKLMIAPPAIKIASAACATAKRCGGLLQRARSIWLLPPQIRNDVHPAERGIRHLQETIKIGVGLIEIYA